MTTVRSAKRTCGRTLSALCTPSFVATLVLAIVSTSCQSLSDAPPRDCIIEGPSHLVPRKLNQIHRGLSKSAVDRIMGAPTRSPAPGEYYYPTGGQCPLGDPALQLTAPCGLVAGFLVQDSDDPSQRVKTGKLETCWWGAIVYGFARDVGNGE